MALPEASLSRLRAVVTAGGLVDGPFAAAIGTPVKALAPFGGGVLLDAALDALRGAGIAEIAVIGGEAIALRLHGTSIRVDPAAADGATNVLRALDAWADGDLLYATSDLPFIGAPDVLAFLAASTGYDLTLPLADGRAYESAYAGAPPHLTTLGAERVANGSVFYIAAAAREPVRRIAAAFFDARKSALGMARLLGPPLLVKFILRRLQIADVERHASRVLGLRTAAIRGAAPALCYDVDTLDDYRYACAFRP